MGQSSFQPSSLSEQCLLGGSLHPLFSWRYTRPYAVRAIPSCAVIVSLCYFEVSVKHIPSSRVALPLFQIEDKLFLHFISLWWCGMWAVWQMYCVTYPHNVRGCGGDCFVDRKLERFGPGRKKMGCDGGKAIYFGFRRFIREQSPPRFTGFMLLLEVNLSSHKILTKNPARDSFRYAQNHIFVQRKDPSRPFQ